MEFDAVLLAPRREKSIASGDWRDLTINEYLDVCLKDCPEKIAVAAYRVDVGDTKSFTYRELGRLADRAAIGLWRLGVRPGDVVAMQLPNWWHFTVLHLACSKIGAVLNPLMMIFRERELSFMLRHGEPRIFVVPKIFRGFDHEAMARALKSEIPTLERIVVAEGGGEDDFENLLTKPVWENEVDAAAILGQHRPAPDDIIQLIYTSGTTGEPKGVMHSSNTLLANVTGYAERMELGEDDVVYMGSPMAHQTGYMYGMMMPITLKGRAVMQDIWEPQKAIEIIRKEGATFTMAATPFLADLTRGVAESGKAVPSLKTFLCGGAPIPGALVEQARKVLGTKIVSAWGMSENGAITAIHLHDDDRLAATTDGLPLRGVELRVVDAGGAELPAGEAGRLLARSCSNFGGYLKRPHWNGTDAEGWLETGDLAYLDENGYVRITGRSKDVIIRGGENIPVVEVENLLYRHPDLAQVAIVAYPDSRLGERACAVVVVKPGRTFDFEEMVEFLKREKLARQYIPERLTVVGAMPTTPSGKIQKFRLRDTLNEGAV